MDSSSILRCGPSTAIETECVGARSSIDRKATKHKRLARAMTVYLAISSAAIPVLIGLDVEYVSTLVPSVLAALSAVVVTWGNVEKPHDRWIVFRRYERSIDAELVRYRNWVPPYSWASDRDRKLAEFLANWTDSLQKEWEGIVPGSDELKELRR